MAFCDLALIAAHQYELCAAATRRLDSLSEAIPGVVYQRVVEPTGAIYYTYISEGARELFGVSPEEIIADPDALFSRHGPEYRAKFRERLRAASDSLTMWDVEATIITPDGKKKYTHAIARPERQENGAVTWTGIILDETRTREALLESIAQSVLRTNPFSSPQRGAGLVESSRSASRSPRASGRAQARRTGRKCAPWYSEELRGLQPGPFASFLLAFWRPVARDLALHGGCEQCDA